MDEDYELIDVGDIRAPIPYSLIDAAKRFNGENELVKIDPVTGRIYLKKYIEKETNTSISLQELMPRTVRL